jgi:hypothetical protein
MLRDAGILCALALSSGAFAQAVDESALEAFDQATPAAPISSEPAGAAELRAAMRRISFNSVHSLGMLCDTSQFIYCYIE